MYFLTFLLKNLLRRKVRTALTAVGVAVAVGTLIALLGIANGFQQSSLDTFEKRGVDLVVIAAKVPNQLSSDLDEQIVHKVRQIPGVREVGPGLIEIFELDKGSTVISVLINGWEPNSFLYNDVTIVSGKRLQASDKRKVLLGSTLAENLNKKVGDTIEMYREEFQVAGIFQSFSVFENGAVISNLVELQELTARKGKVTGFSVVLEPSSVKEKTLEEVREKILAMRDERGRSLGLSAQQTSEYVRSSMHLRLTEAMAWLTSVIAVIIGAIGMLNTMIMSVFERTKEIGILRAIGWRKGRVMRMILGESLLLSLVGAVLGALAAVLLVGWLTRFPQVSGFISGEVSWLIILQGFIMALMVGLIGGLYPAIRAAYLLPTEALRHE